MPDLVLGRGLDPRGLRRLAERRSRMLSLTRERDELAPSLPPEPLRPRLEREPPGLGLEL